MFKFFFRSFDKFRQSCILKIVRRRVKRTEICVSVLCGKYLVCIRYFDFKVLKFIPGLFGAVPSFQIFDNLVHRKGLVVDQKGAKFGPHRHR